VRYVENFTINTWAEQREWTRRFRREVEGILNLPH